VTKDKNTANGVGELVLKDGTRHQVAWEANFGHSPIQGFLHGTHRHLKVAAEDKCATLDLGRGRIAVIAIDRYEDGKAFFTSLWSSMPIFVAEKILFSGPLSDGSEYGIEVVNSKGQTHRTVLPSESIWDLLPQAFDDLKAFFTPKVILANYVPVQTVLTGIDSKYSLVSIAFNGGQPYALSPETARQTADELNELAAKVERGPFGIQ
jgi:hypothetical protein